MGRRSIVAVLLSLAVAAGVLLALKSASAATAALGIRGAPRLLFDSAAWAVWLAPFAALFASGFTRRQEPRIIDRQVLRHDDAAILQHWAHAAGTLILVGSGIALGIRGFLPRLVAGTYADGVAFNIHFLGAVLFVFGSFYYAGNTLMSGRLSEHLPHDVGSSLRVVAAHYSAVLGKGKFPAEGKYFASEHLTYPIAAVGSTLILLTGLIKVAAHGANIPGGLMGAVTLTHDITAVVLGLYLVAHAVAGALVPWSWPLLRSMLTGLVPLDYVREHHAGWYRELTSQTRPEPDDEAAKHAATAS
ncbi:MAG TPA: cytochrome b/b6 domain-containing protein [Coriobacteriia bacterium]|jgi:formate dehydrogenase subunit gamma